MSPAERTVLRSFDLATRPDGTQQVAILFGATHSHKPDSPLFAQTHDAWNYIYKHTTLNNLVMFLEGLVRFPNILLSDEQIFTQFGETASIEARARRAGANNFCSPEPNNVLTVVAEELGPGGYAAVNDYLNARMYMQWAEMPPEVRPSLTEYFFTTLRRYPMIADDPRVNYPGTSGSLTSFQKRWRERHPDHPRFGDMRPSPELFKAFAHETLHPYALAEVEWRRSPSQIAAIRINWYRDAAFINHAVDAAHAGCDVVLVAGDVHIRAMERAMRNLAMECQSTES